MDIGEAYALCEQVALVRRSDACIEWRWHRECRRKLLWRANDSIARAVAAFAGAVGAARRLRHPADQPADHPGRPELRATVSRRARRRPRTRRTWSSSRSPAVARAPPPFRTASWNSFDAPRWSDRKATQVRLLDEVDVITGVSGGSFTALAYGLYGDKLFADYEQRFLKRNVQGEIVARAFSPANWGKLGSTGWGRSELAAELYDEILFNGATFGDLDRGTGPLILASATDISTGSRFVFSQRIFDVICSDLNAVPLSRAAAASSAVPVVLSPVTINNYGGTCNTITPAWVKPFLDSDNPPRPAARAIRSLKAERSLWRQRPSALPPSRRRRRVGQRGHARRARCAGNARSVARSGHADATRQRAQDHRFHRQFAVLAADQLGRVGEPARHRGHSAQGGGHSDRRLFLRGGRTVERHRGALADLAPDPGFGRDGGQHGSCGRRAIRVPNAEIYAIDVSFPALKDKAELDYLNQQPTSFVLPPEAVDRLRAAAGTIIMASPEFQRLLKDVGREGRRG